MNLLKAKPKTSRFDKLPISCGKVPLSVVWKTFKVLSLGNRVMATGMSPMKLFPPSSRYWRLRDNKSMSFGIGPAK